MFALQNQKHHMGTISHGNFMELNYQGCVRCTQPDKWIPESRTSKKEPVLSSCGVIARVKLGHNNHNYQVPCDSRHQRDTAEECINMYDIVHSSLYCRNLQAVAVVIIPGRALVDSIFSNLNMLCTFEQSSVQYKSLLVILLFQFKVNVSLPQNLRHIKNWLIDSQLKNSTCPWNIINILLHQGKLWIKSQWIWASDLHI